MAWSADALYRPVFADFVGPDAPDAAFSLREHDYCLADLKVGGNAQTISRDRWVHHTSFLWSFTAANMALLRMPDKRPDYRRDRPHGDFLTTLQAVAPVGADATVFIDAVVRQLGTMFHPTDVGVEDALAIMVASSERQATHVVHAHA